MNDVNLKKEEVVDNLTKDTTDLDEKDIENKDRDADEEEIEEDESLPFPNARIVRLMRESLDPNKQIKSIVKKEMNIFLGNLVKSICQKMNDFDYSYVDYGMFKQAIETFENIQTIELEKIRIIKALEKIKADCDVLVNDVERKFHA